MRSEDGLLWVIEICGSLKLSLMSANCLTSNIAFEICIGISGYISWGNIEMFYTLRVSKTSSILSQLSVSPLAWSPPWSPPSVHLRPETLTAPPDSAISSPDLSPQSLIFARLVNCTFQLRCICGTILRTIPYSVLPAVCRANIPPGPFLLEKSTELGQVFWAELICRDLPGFSAIEISAIFWET